MSGSVAVTLVVATILGFLSGLGVGGGSLLILWLTAIMDTDPQTARGINLLFFIPAAMITCILRVKSGKLQIKPLLPAIIPACIAAAVFSWLSTLLDVEILKKLFGVILLIAGIRELFYRDRKAR